PDGSQVYRAAAKQALPASRSGARVRLPVLSLSPRGGGPRAPLPPRLRPRHQPRRFGDPRLDCRGAAGPPLAASWHTNLDEFAERRITRLCSWLPGFVREGVADRVEQFVLQTGLLVLWPRPGDFCAQPGAGGHAAQAHRTPGGPDGARHRY